MTKRQTILDVVAASVQELDAQHPPMWAGPEAKAAGKGPVGCATCYPVDGHWPCVSRMVADDLRSLL